MNTCKLSVEISLKSHHRKNSFNGGIPAQTIRTFQSDTAYDSVNWTVDFSSPKKRVGDEVGLGNEAPLAKRVVASAFGTFYCMAGLLYYYLPRLAA